MASTRLTSSRKTCSLRRSTRKDRRTLQSPNQMETALSGYRQIISGRGWASPPCACCPLPWAQLEASFPLERSRPGRMGHRTGDPSQKEGQAGVDIACGLGETHLRVCLTLTLCLLKTRYARDASAHLYLLTSSPSGPEVLGQKGPARPLREDHTPLSPFPPPLAGRMDNRSPYPAEVTRNEASLVSCLSYSFLIRGCPHLPMSVPGRRRSRCSAHMQLYTGPQGVGHRSNSNFNQS